MPKKSRLTTDSPIAHGTFKRDDAERPDPVQTSPKIRRATMDALLKFLPNPNAAATFAVELLALAYPRALVELGGRFTEGEARLILDVMNGTIWIGSEAPGLVGQRIAIEVADGIAIYGHDAKWGVDGAALRAKLANMTSFQLVALELWAAEFWQGDYDGPSFEATHLAKIVGRAA